MSNRFRIFSAAIIIVAATIFSSCLVSIARAEPRI